MYIHININICAISISVYIYISKQPSQGMPSIFFAESHFPWPVGRPWWCRWLRHIRWDQWMSPWKSKVSCWGVYGIQSLEVSSNGGYPQFIRILPYIYISLETYGDLGIPYQHTSILKGLNPQKWIKMIGRSKSETSNPWLIHEQPPSKW